MNRPELAVVDQVARELLSAARRLHRLKDVSSKDVGSKSTPKQGSVRRCALIIGVHGTRGIYTDARNVRAHASSAFDRVVVLTSARDTTAQNIHCAVRSCISSSRFVWVHFSGYDNTGSDGEPLRIVEELSASSRFSLLTVDCLKWSPPRSFQRYRYSSSGNLQREFARPYNKNLVLCLYPEPARAVTSQHRLKGLGFTSALLRALEDGTTTIDALLRRLQKDMGVNIYFSVAGRLVPEPRRAPWLW